MWALSPSGLQGRSLVEALAEEVSTFSRRTGVEASFVEQGDNASLDEQRAVALLRVAQEALRNVEKHATARRVRVRLEVEHGAGQQRSLSIVDDGRGFALPLPTDARGAGFGLISMRERSRLAGGDLYIESSRLRYTRPRTCTRWQRAQKSNVPRRSSWPSCPSSRSACSSSTTILAREGIRRLVEGRPNMLVIGEASDGLEGAARCLALRPDVILMDLQMPQPTASPAFAQCARHWPEARVLVLTTFGEDEHFFEALRRSARIPAEERRRGRSGRCDRDRSSWRRAGPAEAGHAFAVERFGALAERAQMAEVLTEREAEVLRLVATGARNRDIAAGLVVAEKTIKHHVGQIHAKLGVRTRTEAVARARQLGLLPLDSFAIA